MSTLLRTTKAELRRAGLFDEDADFDGAVATTVTAMMETFVAYGQSGGSAAMTLQVFNRLANHLPLAPLTGEDEEWDAPRDGLTQNLRCSRVFKNVETGIAFDVKLDKGRSITFPYTPEL